MRNQANGHEPHHECGHASAGLRMMVRCPRARALDAHPRYYSRRSCTCGFLKVRALAMSKNSLSVGPGQSAVTLMPNRATSAASPCCEEAIEDLGGRVSGEVGHGLKARCRCQDQHPPSSPLHHTRDERVAKAAPPPRSSRGPAQPLLHGLAGEGTVLAQSRIVDKDVDGEAGAFSGVEDLLQAQQDR